MLLSPSLNLTLVYHPCHDRAKNCECNGKLAEFCKCYIQKCSPQCKCVCSKVDETQVFLRNTDQEADYVGNLIPHISLNQENPGLSLPANGLQSRIISESDKIRVQLSQNLSDGVENMSIDHFIENLEENDKTSSESNAQPSRIKSRKRKTGGDNNENGQSTSRNTQKKPTNEQR